MEVPAVRRLCLSPSVSTENSINIFLPERTQKRKRTFDFTIKTAAKVRRTKEWGNSGGLRQRLGVENDGEGDMRRPKLLMMTRSVLCEC